MTNRSATLAKLGLLLTLTAAAPAALAQGVTGAAVTGTVTEESGRPLEGAAVQLKNPGTGDTFNAVTGSAGDFFLDNVPAGGPYTISATAPGHSTATEKDVFLTLGERVKLNLPMRSAFGEEIAVVAHNDRLADRNRTGPSSTLKSATITELPLQGRNFTDLLKTDPRVSGNSFAGQNDRYNNIQIDGGANNDLFGLANNGAKAAESLGISRQRLFSYTSGKTLPRAPMFDLILQKWELNLLGKRPRPDGVPFNRGAVRGSQSAQPSLFDSPVTLKSNELKVVIKRKGPRLVASIEIATDVEIA